MRYLIAAAADDEEDDNEDEEDNDGGGAMNTPRLSAFGSGYVDAGTNSNRPVMAFSFGRYSTIERIFFLTAVDGPADERNTRELERSSNWELARLAKRGEGMLGNGL